MPNKNRLWLALLAGAVVLAARGFLIGGSPPQSPEPAAAPAADKLAGPPTALATIAAGPVPQSKGMPAPEIHAESALVLDEGSGSVLFEHDGYRRLPPASLTKIATAAVVIQAGDLERVVEAHPDLDRAYLDNTAVMGLQRGDRFSRMEFLYGLMLLSGYDAAEVLATDNAGSSQAFVLRMNALASSLQLKDTHFTDPAGLDSGEQYSTAYDLALLARHAMRLDVFRQIVGTESHTAKGSRDLKLYNTNPLLNYTPGVDGVKTGWTEEAGRTFVASASRDGHRIFVVLLNTTARAEDAIALIEWAFSNWTWQPSPQSVVGNAGS